LRHRRPERAGDGAARRIRIVIGGSEQCAGTGSEDNRACGFLIELALVAGKRLAGGQVDWKAAVGGPSRIGV
jgi:hypothetical protein